MPTRNPVLKNRNHAGAVRTSATQIIQAMTHGTVVNRTVELGYVGLFFGPPWRACREEAARFGGKRMYCSYGFYLHHLSIVELRPVIYQRDLIIQGPKIV